MEYWGKSPKKRKWKALCVVYDELLPNQESIRAIDLKAKGKISTSTLVRRLKQLESNGWVRRIVNPRTSPPSVYYFKEPLPTVVFFEWKDSRLTVAESLKPTSLGQFPYMALGLPHRMRARAQDIEASHLEQEDMSRSPNNAETNEQQTLENLSETDKRQIMKLKAQKIKAKLRSEIAEIKNRAKTAEIDPNEIAKVLILLARTNIASESNLNDTHFQEQANRTWSHLLRILKKSGNQRIFEEAIEELCEELSVSLEQFVKDRELLQDYGLDASDLSI